MAVGLIRVRFFQYKFALITMGRAEYISDDDVVINLADFKNNSNNQRKIQLFASIYVIVTNIF